MLCSELGVTELVQAAWETFEAYFRELESFMTLFYVTFKYSNQLFSRL